MARNPVTRSQFRIDSTKKKPRGVSGGARFSFFLSKEAIANSVTGYRWVFVVLDLDLVVFVVIVLLASKSWFCSVNVTECNRTSLGHHIQSKSCANPGNGHAISSI